MNLKALNLKWTLAFLAAAAAGVVGVVLVLTLTGGRDERVGAEETTPPVPPVATQVETPAVVRPRPTYYPLPVPTLPSGFTLAPKRSCPERWQRISDDVLNYSICIPPDWGILDEKTGGRSTEFTDHARGLKILSGEGFPYPIGTPLYEVLGETDKNLVYMTLGAAPPGSSIPCHVEPRSSLGQFPASQCQLRFNFTNWGDPDYRSDGAMVETEIIVRLPNPEAGLGGPRTGYGLLIGMTASEKAMEVHGDTISEILSTFEGQP
jgi:hypothetical protein